MSLTSQELLGLIDAQAHALTQLKLTTPSLGWVTHPLRYARAGHVAYMERFGGDTARRVLFVGMNPGPWGMAQTGVPFGDVVMVRDWMGLQAVIEQPEAPCPRRPVQGFALTRREGSGKRLWGWAASRFGQASSFFAQAFVWCYCPMLFLASERARNITPDQLLKQDQAAIFGPCDVMLDALLEHLQPQVVVGIGRFAHGRAAQVIRARPAQRQPQLGLILHPSPANPQANQGWEQTIEAQLVAMGLGDWLATAQPSAARHSAARGQGDA